MYSYMHFKNKENAERFELIQGDFSNFPYGMDAILDEPCDFIIQRAASEEHAKRVYNLYREGKAQEILGDFDYSGSKRLHGFRCLTIFADQVCD